MTRYTDGPGQEPQRRERDQADAENAAVLEMEPLEGEVCPQMIRCGKPGCRCESGHLHGPYHYRIWRDGTHVRKVYVKASEVEDVKAACALHRNLSRSFQDVKQAKRLLTQSIQREWRRTERLRGSDFSSR